MKFELSDFELSVLHALVRHAEKKDTYSQYVHIGSRDAIKISLRQIKNKIENYFRMEK